MIRSMLRSAGAVLLSLVVAFVLIVAVEGISAVVHPFPPEFDGSYEQVAEHVTRYPAWILAMVVVIWGAITFACTWLATRLGTRRHAAHGALVGTLLLAAVAFNMYHLPYPRWFEVMNLLVFALAIWFGIRLGRGQGGLS